MARNQDSQEESSVGTKYYRTMIAGLSVVVGEAEEGDIGPKTVRFTPYEERVDGDRSNVGYLATNNATAISKLAKDYNVEEISEDEYSKATDPEVNPKVKRAAF